jgi:uncharacterized protein YbjT (DUF2867 family)
MKVFVYGATGSIGTKVVEGLLSKGHEVYAGTRNPSKHTSSDKLHWVFADVQKEKEGIEVLEKVEAGFFISPPGLTNQFSIINPWLEKAKQVKLKKFILNTAMGVEFAPPEVPFRKLELALETSGLNYNIIRPNWFMENFQTYWISGILKDKKIYFPAGNATTSFISVEDIANVAIHLLEEDKFTNKALNLTGKESITHTEVASLLSKATGHTIEYLDITPEEFKSSLLQAGLPNDYAEFLTMIAGALKSGAASQILPTVKEITGKEPISFKEYAEKNKNAWK